MKKVIVVAVVLCVLLVACGTEPVASTTLTSSKSNNTVQVQPKACQVLQGQLTKLQQMYQSAIHARKLLLNSDERSSTEVGAVDESIKKLHMQVDQAQAKLTTCLNSSSSTSP